MDFRKARPRVVLDRGLDDKLGFEDIRGVKIYRSTWEDLKDPEDRERNDKLKERLEKFEEHYRGISGDIVGEVVDFEGNHLYSIYLHEVIDFRKYERESYENTWAYTRVAQVERIYTLFEGLKRYKLTGNSLYSWFSEEFIDRSFNETLLPQELGDGGNVTLIEDGKDEVVVSYGKKGDLQRQERKRVYCSTRGRFIRYRGRNLYIKEGRDYLT